MPREKFDMIVKNISVKVPEITNDIAEDWIKNYEDSITRIKEWRKTWGKVTKDILRELYIARESLSKRGHRKDLFPNGTKTFKDYLYDIDLPSTTAYRWLRMYDPETGEIIENPNGKTTENKNGQLENSKRKPDNPKRVLQGLKKTLNKTIKEFEETVDRVALQEFRRDMNQAFKKLEKRLMKENVKV